MPLTLNDGTPLPGRGDVIFISAGVIVLTMLVQGPLLPVVVRWARLPEEPEEEELRMAELAITSAAVTAVDDLASELGTRAGIRGRVADEYQTHPVGDASPQGRFRSGLDHTITPGGNNASPGRTRAETGSTPGAPPCRHGR